MSKITITEAFEQPLRWIKQTAGSEKYAVITLHLEPLPTEAVEFGVALPDISLIPDFDVSYVAYTERGVQNYARNHGVVGIRVTLISVEAHPVDSNHVSFEIAGYQAMLQAMAAHGVPVSG